MNKNDLRSQKGMERMRHIHDLETENIVNTVDVWEMNEALQDPKQALPRPRNDLPKNKHHQSIHQP